MGSVPIRKLDPHSPGYCSWHLEGHPVWWQHYYLGDLRRAFIKLTLFFRVKRHMMSVERRRLWGVKDIDFKSRSSVTGQYVRATGVCRRLAVCSGEGSCSPPFHRLAYRHFTIRPEIMYAPHQKSTSKGLRRRSMDIRPRLSSQVRKSC